MKHAIFLKYNMIRYYYTELGMLSEDGGAFYKPLFFEFPEDENAYKDQELNIMLGEALKLSVLTNKLDQNTTSFYFPEGVWCNVFDTNLKTNSCIAYTGESVEMDSKAWNYHLHLRQGYVVPLQDAETLGVRTSKDLQDHPVDFHVNPSCANNLCVASGRYLNDDGETLNVDTDRNIYNIAFAGV